MNRGQQTVAALVAALCVLLAVNCARAPVVPVVETAGTSPPALRRPRGGISRTRGCGSKRVGCGTRP